VPKKPYSEKVVILFANVKNNLPSSALGFSMYVSTLRKMAVEKMAVGKVQNKPLANLQKFLPSVF